MDAQILGTQIIRLDPCLRILYFCCLFCSDPGLKTYKDFKMAASDYQFAKHQMLEAFRSWVHKPDDFLDFTVSAD